MKKSIFAIMLSLSGTVWAEVNCVAIREQEALEIKILDTFIGKTAFIKRQHPQFSFPAESLLVEIFEKSKSVTFINLEKDFSLKLDKVQVGTGHPPLHRGQLQYGEIFTGMDCSIL